MPEKNWLENLVKEMNENIVGVGGCIRNIGADIWGKTIALTADTFLGSANSIQGRVFEEKRYVRSVSGSNSLYRKKDLLRIGGFNTALSVNEETELNLRLSKIGRLFYTPNAMVLHNQGRGLKSFAKRMYQFGFGRGRLRLWGLQCVVPLAIPIILFSILLSPWVFASVIAAYLTTLFLIGFKFVVREKSYKYVVSVPIVYAIEHSSYSIGFFRGLFQVW
jgi:hypothetical protein